jgi:fructose-1,6-bisphosphatase II
VYVADLTVAILDRPRHEGLIEEVRRAGARVKLLTDGDVAAALATTHPSAGIDMLIGVGGAQQGVLSAAALRCAGGDMQGRFRARNEEEAERAREFGIRDFKKIYTREEMASGSVMFAGTGVTNGDYLAGVHFFRGGATTNSVVMRSRTHTVRFIRSTHRFDLKPDY